MHHWRYYGTAKRGEDAFAHVWSRPNIDDGHEEYSLSKDEFILPTGGVFSSLETLETLVDVIVEPKKYYYYTKWWLSGSGELPEGFYHTIWISESTPKEFVSNIYDVDYLNEYFIKQFKTEDEMNEYWEKVNK